MELPYIIITLLIANLLSPMPLQANPDTDQVASKVAFGTLARLSEPEPQKTDCGLGAYG